MNNYRPFAKLIVGVAFFWVSSKLFVGSGVADSWFQGSLESGKLGQTGFTISKNVAELIITLITAVTATGIFSKSKLLTWLLEAIKPIIQGFSSEPTEVLEPQDALERDLSNILLHAISKKDKTLTIMMCEELAGEAYMTEAVKTAAKAK